MKNQTLLLLLLAFPVLGSAQNNSDGFVVLELFTSQGCSSCPPADEILGEYASKDDSHILTLAFHVDYWNNLGWKDPYSDKKFTARQRLYAEALPSSVYTPQLVVNGKHGIVGSEENGITNLIAGEKKLKTGNTIKIASSAVNGNQLTVKYNCNTSIKDGYLNAALVRKKETTNVKRGENSGRKLINYSIVTDFKNAPLGNSQSGEISFAFDTAKTPSEYEIVLYIQESEVGKIVAAAKSEIK